MPKQATRVLFAVLLAGCAADATKITPETPVVWECTYKLYDAKFVPTPTHPKPDLMAWSPDIPAADRCSPSAEFSPFGDTRGCFWNALEMARAKVDGMNRWSQQADCTATTEPCKVSCNYCVLAGEPAPWCSGADAGKP